MSDRPFCNNLLGDKKVLAPETLVKSHPELKSIAEIETDDAPGEYPLLA